MTKEDVKRALEEQYGGEEEVILDLILLIHIFSLDCRFAELFFIYRLFLIYIAVATNKSWI